MGRFWWLFLLPAFAGVYFFVVFALIELGKTHEPHAAKNSALELAQTLAPWSADAAIANSTYQRAYGITQTGDAYWQAINLALVHAEQAIERRPFWPYYQLSAFDAEYLLNSDPQIIQARFDRIVEVAPNERGLDRNLLELSVLSWQKLRDDQKRWVGKRLLTAKHATRKATIALIAQQLPVTNSFCYELPWSLVRRICTYRQ